MKQSKSDEFERWRQTFAKKSCQKKNLLDFLPKVFTLKPQIENGNGDELY